jgi:hypothetical protein
MAGVIDVSKRSGSDCASGIASTNFSISVADIFEKVDSDVVKFNIV